MKSRTQQPKKRVFNVNRQNRILPAVFIVLSLLLMILPLESPVASAKALLSYIFIPQIRASHAVMEYAEGVSDTVKALLHTQRENVLLQEEMGRLRLENAQAQEIFAENKRLTAALNLPAPSIWRGVWAKTAYRDPTQWNSVVIDKGSLDGIHERAAVIALKNTEPVLAGMVLETDEHTAKVLLLRDEDFAAAVYALPSHEEGLLSGAGAGQMRMQYLPYLSEIKAGEKVYTSSSSSIFPAGILVGEIAEVEDENGLQTSLTARVEPEADASVTRELFVLTPQKAEVK